MKKIISLVLLLCLLTQVLPALATESEPIPIHTVEDLLAMAENPTGSYILMADLDLAGIPWKSLDFSGSFDGNGHTLINLTIMAPGDQMPDSVDGNRNRYETAYFGFFGTLRDARVKDLTLLGVRADIEYDGPVFLAGLAGYAENTTITGCTVTGTLELRAHDRMFGIGGIVGYGGGSIEKCTVDVTLINTDTDAQTKDEQFLGGIYATGFIQVRRCHVTLDGYISDHGYVHSGGIVGMFMAYPHGSGQKGYICNNHVSGKITFFEDNGNRRAYCEPFVGEALVNRWYLDHNTQDFLRDERFTYDVDLHPEMCAQPAYTETVTAPDCENFGFTTYTCQGCGYAYTASYTLPEHTVTNWELIKAPTYEEDGISAGTCPCGQEFTRTEPKLEPIPTTAAPTAAPTEAPVQIPAETLPAPARPEQDRLFYILIGADIALAVLAVALIAALIRRKRRP